MDRSSPPKIKGVRLFVWGVALGTALTIPVYLYFGQGLRDGIGRMMAGEPAVEEKAPAKTDARRRPIRKVPIKPAIVPDILPPVLPDGPARDEAGGGEVIAVASADDPNPFNWISVNQSNVYQTAKWQPVTVPPYLGSRAPEKDQRPPTSFTKVIDGVIVPVPSEIFAMMDKVGKQHWVATQRPLAEVAKPFGTQSQQAFFLGTLFAEGFIATELQDAEQVQLIGRSLIGCGQALGLRQAIIPNVSAILSAARTGNWMNVRREMNRTLGSVKEALIEFKSPELADLIVLGGWARGTEALCRALESNWSPALGKLASQQALATAFYEQLRSLKTRLKQEPLVLQTATALRKVRPLMEPDFTGHLFPSAVKQIGQVAADFVTEIQTPPQSARSGTANRTSAL